MPVVESPPSAPVLAGRLQASIGESGVFYESHVSKWFRGGYPRQALEHEPQMWRTQALRSSINEPVLTGPLRPVSEGFPSVPWAPQTTILSPRMGHIPMFGAVMSSRESPSTGVAVTAQGLGGPGAAVGRGAQAPGGSAPSVSPSVASSVPGGPVPPTPISFSVPSGASIESSMTSLPADPISDALQGIVRHQLEMLVTPVLRWEGDVWSGIFMALMIHVPEEALSHHRSQQQGGGDGEREENDPAWHSELTLRMASLGSIGVSLRLKEKRLALTLTAESTPVVMRLEQGQAELKSRLTRCGFEEVALRVNLAVSEGNTL